MDPMPLSESQLTLHAGSVRRLARVLLSDPAAAEDVSQEALLLAWERSGAPRQSIGGWLAGVVRRLGSVRARGEARRRARERAVATPEAQPSASESAESLETAELLIAKVRALPPSQAEVIWLRFWEDLPPRAIAERLDLGVEAVKTRLKRGLAALRRELDAHTPGGRRAWLSALAPLWGGALPSPPALLLGTPPVLIVKKISILVLLAASFLLVLTLLDRGDSRDSTQVPASVAGAALEDPSRESALSPPEPTGSATERAPSGSAHSRSGPLLAVRVVREIDRSPIPGVLVAAIEEDRPALASVGRQRRSDGAGRVLFDDLSGGPVLLIADRGQRLTAQVAETGRTEVDLALRHGVRVRGAVVSPEGSPVAGATVLLQRGELWDHWTDVSPVATTGEDGRFELVDVRPEACLGARASGWGPSDLEELRHRALEPGGELELTLRLGGSGGGVRGVVLAPDGEPVVGAHLWVGEAHVPQSPVPPWRRIPLPTCMRTGEDGTFAVDGLALGLAWIVVAAPGYARQLTRAPVGLDGESPVVIRLLHSAGIDGRVIDAAGLGRPGAFVHLVRVGGYADAFYGPLGFPVVQTDAEGRFHYDELPPGHAEVNTTIEGAPHLQGAAMLEAGRRNEIELRAAGGSILSGCALEGDGTPLARATVVVTGPGGYRIGVGTDEDGGFRFEGVPDGELELALYADDRSRPVITREGIRAADSPVRLVWEGDRTLGVVHGHFEDAGGWIQPGDRALVQLHGEGRFAGEVEIEPNGRFRFEDVDPGGGYRVVVHARDMTILASEEFEVEGGDTVHLTKLRTEEPASVRLTVLTGDASTEVWGILRDPQRGLTWILRREDDVLSHARVPPGRWQLRLNAGGFASEVLDLELAPGESWERSHACVPVPATHLLLALPELTEEPYRRAINYRILRPEGVLVHEGGSVGIDLVGGGLPVHLLPGRYRIEVRDGHLGWDGVGEFEIAEDDGSDMERKIAVPLTAR